MLAALLEPHLLVPILSHAVPMLFAIGALLAGAAATPIAWARARHVTTVALLTAVATAITGAATSTAWIVAHAAVLVLIAFIGHVIARFTATYLAGEPDQPRFVRWLLATLCGATLVVATNNLGVLVGAWLLASLSLQNLLLFHAHRPAAQMAAHKKFLVSRMADACAIGAIALLASRFGTLEIDTIVAAVAGGAELGAAGRVAVVALATAALLKSAQLPFHGWLMQVMEAPTPVSALLHAGVVNLGGFVLIRLHTLVAAEPVAQTLLVVVGSVTATVAALVATTRISIKVALAWSTCAQMGFMVLQCGLGLPEMALLHLVAHSLYKANAFLGAGTAVHHAVVANLTPRPEPAKAAARLVALAFGAAAVWAASTVFDVSLTTEPAVFAMGTVVALATVPLAARGGGTNDRVAWLVRFGAAAAIVFVWFGLHATMHAWLGAPSAPSPAAASLAAWTALTFVALFAAQTFVVSRPQATAVRRLHARCFGGLFLDEWFTRLTLRVWPNQVARSSGSVSIDRESR